MTFKQLIQLLPKVVRYNLKIIFAGKFFWFLLAAKIVFRSGCIWLFCSFHVSECLETGGD